VIEQALEADVFLGGDKSRGYCLEMICADFLAGVNMEGANPETLVHSLRHVCEPCLQRALYAFGSANYPSQRLKPKYPDTAKFLTISP
jgi:hypothetical protein